MISALNHRPPLLRLSAVSMLIMLLTGTAFLLMRYYRVTGQGSSFAYSFEIGRMLINFGGMALLSPLIYRTTALAQHHRKMAALILFLGLLTFGLAYLLLNKLGLFLMTGMSSPLHLWKGSNKLFINFSHILVLFYMAIVYGSWVLIKGKGRPIQADRESSDNKSLTLSINGIAQEVHLAELEYIQTYDHYLKLFRKGRFDLMRIPLSKLTKDLPDDFIRIHRSTMVHAIFVDKVVRKKGHYWVVMKDGEQLKVSASYQKRVLSLFRKN